MAETYIVGYSGHINICRRSCWSNIPSPVAAQISDAFRCSLAGCPRRSLSAILANRPRTSFLNSRISDRYAIGQRVNDDNNNQTASGQIMTNLLSQRERLANLICLWKDVCYDDHLLAEVLLWGYDVIKWHVAWLQRTKRRATEWIRESQ